MTTFFGHVNWFNTYRKLKELQETLKAHFYIFCEIRLSRRVGYRFQMSVHNLIVQYHFYSKYNFLETGNYLLSGFLVFLIQIRTYWHHVTTFFGHVNWFNTYRKLKELQETLKAHLYIFCEIRLSRRVGYRFQMSVHNLIVQYHFYSKYNFLETGNYLLSGFLAFLIQIRTYCFAVWC